MAHNDAKSCHKVEMDIMSSVTWLLFRQHSKVFGFVFLRECSYAGECLLWTCALRVSAHTGDWVNTCQGLYSVHDTADNSRAYGATVFVYWPAVITIGLCLFLFQDLKTSCTNNYDSLGQVQSIKNEKLKGTMFLKFHQKGFLHNQWKCTVWSGFDVAECGQT